MILNPRPTMEQQGYQIKSTPAGKQLADVCASFQYRGFNISFSTHNYASGGCANPVEYWRETSGGADVADTVEDAIKAIDAYHKREYELDCI